MIIEKVRRQVAPKQARFLRNALPLPRGQAMALLKTLRATLRRFWFAIEPNGLDWYGMDKKARWWWDGEVMAIVVTRR